MVDVYRATMELMRTASLLPQVFCAVCIGMLFFLVFRTMGSVRD